MKTEQHGVSLVPVPMPAEARPDSVTDRRSAAHYRDPLQHWPQPAAGPDLRLRIEAAGSAQRVPARQAEPRDAGLCHVRKPRRDPLAD